MERGRMSIHRSIVLLVAFLLFLSSCVAPGNQSAVPAGTRSPAGMMTATPTLASVPPEPTLSPVPQHCPVSNPTPHMILPGLGPVIGASPVWAGWPRGPVIAHLSPPPGTPDTYEPPYGWAMLKTIWEVGPNYTHPVTVRGYDLVDHTPLLIQFLDNPPKADAVLDAQHPDHPVSVVGEGWAEWGSNFVVPKAGCYVVDVSWPTGHWSVTFAAGA